MTYLYTYSLKSKGAKLLAKALGVRMIGKDTRVKPLPHELIINWGGSDARAPLYLTAHRPWLNLPLTMDVCINKLAFFKQLNTKPYIPWWTDSRQEAVQRMRDTGCKIVCRTTLTGSGGAGIVIADTEEQLVNAPLYVEYINKKDEYRIHVGMMDGRVEVIDKQLKARKKGIPDGEVNWQVRNHENGFIYMRGGVNFPESVVNAACDCLRSLDGATFGAVDIIYDAAKGKAYVLEINTAPGLQGQTVDNYAKYFRKVMGNG